MSGKSFISARARRILSYKTRDLATGSLLGIIYHPPRQALAAATRPPARADTHPGACTTTNVQNFFLNGLRYYTLS